MTDNAEVRDLPEQQEGQARTMTICKGQGTFTAEIGRWYSPDKVRALIAEEREACAKVCDEFDAENPHIGQAARVAKILRSNAKITGG